MMNERERQLRKKDIQQMDSMRKEILLLKDSLFEADEKVKDFKDMYTELCCLRAQELEERDKLRGERDMLRDIIKGKDQQILRLASQKDMYDMSDAVEVETPSKNLKWQDAMLIGVFVLTCFSALVELS